MATLSVVLACCEQEYWFTKALNRAAQVSDAMVLVRTSVHQGRLTKSISTTCNQTLAVIADWYQGHQAHA